MSQRNLSANRRQFLASCLRGVPTYLALPSLISLLPKEVRAQNKDAMNFLLMYVPDGTFGQNIVGQQMVKDGSMARWFPATGPLPAQLPMMMRKLESVKNDFSLISGLNAHVRKDACAFAGHAVMAQFLTGNTLTANQCGDGFSENDSIDQIIGAKLAGKNEASAIQKYVVSAQMTTSLNGSSVIKTWANSLSFYKNKPGFSYTSPRKLFNDIFGGIPIPPVGGDSVPYANVLDVHLEDIRQKRRLASQEDKIILDRWLTNYEELRATLSQPVPSKPGSCTPPTAPNDQWDTSNITAITNNYDAISKAFLDLYLAGMECGARKIFTFLLMNESCGGTFWHNVVADEDLHLEGTTKLARNEMNASHHLNMAHYMDPQDQSNIRGYMRLQTLTNYYMRKYRYVIEQMKARGLFDNSLAILTWGFRDGQHNIGGTADFPLLCAGRGGGFKTGYHHRLINKKPNEVGKNPTFAIPHVSNLWVSVLKKYGIPYNNEYVTGNCDQLFG